MPTILIDRSRFVSAKLILNARDDVVAGRIFFSPVHNGCLWKISAILRSWFLIGKLLLFLILRNKVEYF